MTKVLDLDSNPDEPLNGQNELAADGTGIITIQVAKLKLLTAPRAQPGDGSPGSHSAGAGQSD